jgi:peptidoglycan hydrolase CwlO-like protein
VISNADNTKTEFQGKLSDIIASIGEAKAELIDADNTLNNKIDLVITKTDTIKTEIANSNKEIQQKLDDLNKKVESVVAIKGSVDTFADLPNADDYKVGDAFIVEEDENK